MSDPNDRIEMLRQLADRNATGSSDLRRGAHVSGRRAAADGLIAAPERRTEPAGHDEDAERKGDPAIDQVEQDAPERKAEVWMAEPAEGPPALTRDPGAAPTPVEAGLRLLSGRYLLQERIASGGMASVWRARDEVLARTVAVKLLHDHLAADADFRERFRREAISAAKLSHPFIVGIFDSGIDGDQVFLVMEFVEGMTLRDLIVETGALPAGRAAAIGEKVARALDYAHGRGLVHRDVKPANILMGTDGAVKVADFGIAKADQVDDLTKTGMVLGTAAYVAPEQILARPTDGKTDQYSLGCVLYETLTGRQPFKAETAVATAAQRLERRTPAVRAYRTDVPSGLDRIVARAMSKEPDERFPTAGELADALSVYSAGDTDRTTALLNTSPDPPRLPSDANGSTAALWTGHGETPATRRRRSVTHTPPTPPPRRMGWIAPALGLLVFLGGLGAAMWSGALETGRSPEPTGEPSAAPPPPSALPVDAEALRSFDPQGEDGERDGDLRYLVDSDPSTSWTTEGYRTEEFGGLKSGVGFVVDLGSQATVDAVQLTVQSEGIDLELRTAEAAPGDLSETTPVATAESVGAQAELRPDGPVTTRHLVVWITGGLPDSNQGAHPHRASLAELIVQGRPSTS